jgi:peptidyl-dipeptidase Dcp
MSIENNALLAEWTGPYGGVPPLDNVQVSFFQPALEAAMAENLLEIDKITANPKLPTFENTIAAMERAGQTLTRISTIYGIWSGNMSTPDFQAVETEMEPKLAAFNDQIMQNELLFKRIEAVYNAPEKASLTPEQQRLVWYYYDHFERAGAKLDAVTKERVSQINQQLAGLFTQFSQNLLADEELTMVIDNEADLAGLPQSFIDAAAAAGEKVKAGTWLLLNTRSSIDPFLTYAENRELREKAWRLFVSRGDNGGTTDNKAIITQILQLRAERAALLGHTTHAHWRLGNSMAKTPERTLELMEAVWEPAVKRVQEEVADMQALANSEGANIKIEPWDYRFYAEKVRKAKYDLDQNEVKEYLQLDKIRDAMFWVAGELFDLQFTQVYDVPVYQSDVLVWEVTNKVSGKHIGLWYFDAYARTGKQSGAWMNDYRSQQKMDKEITTIVTNNCNYVQGVNGEPTLISWDDATTLFHEFGHALHGLASNVVYPSLSGTNVVRDYVEFPSQLLEHWLATPEVLQRFALHYKTGQPIPDSLVKRIEKAATFNSGFETVEYLSSALMDMKLHLAGAQAIDPANFEKQTLESLGMPFEIVMRHRTPQFAHIFSNDGYSAGYYSYLWADVLTADAYEAFVEAGGPYDKALAKRLYETALQTGNTIDPAEAYRNFRGRDPQVEALMKKRGF